MLLRTRIALIVTLVVLLYAAADHVAQRMVVLPRFSELERHEARKDIERVRLALNAELDQLDSRCVEWAAWDPTHEFVQACRAGDPASPVVARYVDSNLGPTAFRNGRIHALYVVGRDGTVHWGRARDLETGAELELRDLSFEKLLPRHPMLVKERRDASGAELEPEPVRGLMITGLGPMLVASRPILTSERELPWLGTLIMGRLLDDALVRRLVARTEVEFRAWPLEGGDLPLAERAVLDEVTGSLEPVIRAQDDDRLAVYTTLDDAKRVPALLVRADVPREISRQGATAVSYALVSTAGAGVLLLAVLLIALGRTVINPLAALTRHALEIGRTENYSAKLDLARSDEIGILSREFDRMIEKLEASRAQFGQAARTAGMSEIATGVLHNVGNVLNSVNVAANMVAQRVQGSKLGKLEKLVEMVEAQGDKLGDFITSHPKGKHVAPFLGEVTRNLRGDQEAIAGELKALNDGIEHIRKLVDSQQALAGKSQLAEAFDLDEQIELAVTLSGQAASGRAIVVERDVEGLGRVTLDRHKLTQVLVNLIKNARESIEEAGSSGPIRVRARAVDGLLRIEVCDDGVGILPENLAKVFNHGFTTKPNGHGFGLHSSANAATEMGGKLRVESAGPRLGATFLLELPAAPARAATASTP